MTETILMGIGIVVVLLASLIISAYASTGEEAKLPKYVNPNQERAVNYLARHKLFASQLLKTTAALVFALTVFVSAEAIGAFSIASTFLLLIIAFFVLPALHLPEFVKRPAYLLAPAIRKAVERLKPLGRQLEFAAKKVTPAQTDTGVYTETDLKHLLDEQKHARGNQIEGYKLDNLIKRIEFDEKKTGGVMTKLSEVKKIGASEAIGPILIDELHKSNHKFFPVIEEFNKEIIGLLELDSLTSLKKEGTAKDAMNGRVAFVDEDDTIRDVLKRCVSNDAKVFLVNKDHGKPTGVISFEQIIAELTGENSQ